MSSVAWYAQSGKRKLIIRAMPHNSTKPVTYAQELAVLHHLHKYHCPVPEPIATNHQTPANDLPEIGFMWAITTPVNGNPIHNAYLNTKNAHQLGEFFANLHRIPAQGWGWLHVEKGIFSAQQPDAIRGTLERWSDYPMFPLDSRATLESTVIGSHFPMYIPLLNTFIDEMHAAAAEGQPTICHIDTHRGHLYLADGQLSGIIDFGDVCILPPAWDFAVAARHYGWRAADDMLESYTDNHNRRQDMRQQAYYLGLITAIYKLQRQFVERSPVISRARTLQFLKHTLNRLGAHI